MATANSTGRPPGCVYFAHFTHAQWSLLLTALDRYADQYRQDIWDSFPHLKKPARESAASIETLTEHRQACLAIMKANAGVETLLLQAQALLNDADEANHGGHVVTYDLQRQARAVLAEAIDELLRDMAERGERAGGHGGDRQSSRSVQLADIGLSRDESSRFQQIAAKHEAQESDPVEHEHVRELGATRCLYCRRPMPLSAPTCASTARDIRAWNRAYSGGAS